MKAAGGDSCISLCQLYPHPAELVSVPPPPQTTACQGVWLFVCFYISSPAFTLAASCLLKKNRKGKKKKKALVCSGCGASEMNVLPPIAATAGIGNSVRATWAGGTKHIVPCPLSSILLQTPPGCRGTTLLLGKAGNSSASFLWPVAFSANHSAGFSCADHHKL